MITRIREVRRAKGLTLAEVGDRCDPPTTAQTIGRLETGTRTVSVDWLNRIATALGVDAGILSNCPNARICLWPPSLARMGPALRVMSRSPPRPRPKLDLLRSSSKQGLATIEPETKSGVRG